MLKWIKDLRRNLKLNRLLNKTFDSMEEAVVKEKKSFWKSKTFWLNLLAFINEVLKYIPATAEASPSFTVPTEVLVMALPAANILLRKFTKVPIVLSEKKITDYEFK